MKQSRPVYLALVKISVGLALTLTLQGCAISQLTSGLGSSLFGSSSKQANEKWEPIVSEERLLAAAKTDPNGPSDVPTSAQGCPKFVVWPKDRNITVYEPGKVGDGLAIKYRGEITKTARECQLIPGQVTVKYGFAGRVLLGPKGATGPKTLPAIIHVTDKDRNKIKSETVNVTVSMSPNQPIGYFSYVRRISFAMPPGSRPSDFKLFIAFDKKVPGAS